MPFQRLRLLIAYDNARGLCGAVVPRMRAMLEHRAFEVELLEIGDAPVAVDLTEYSGLVLGTPAMGLGVRGVGPSARVKAFVAAQGGLEEVKVAVFCVYELLPGYTLRNTRQLVLDAGGQAICAQPYWRLRPEHDEHVLPAECMVRVR